MHFDDDLSCYGLRIINSHLVFLKKKLFLPFFFIYIIFLFYFIFKNIMTNSLPSRNSRKSINLSTDDTLKKKYGSLKIITTSEKEEVSISSPSSVRQRLSSLFRTSSPVVMTLKETFNKRVSLSTVSFTPVTEEPMEPMDDTHSTTTTLSSDSSDHMPSSPADNKALSSWQPSVTELTFETTTTKVSSSPPPIPIHFATTKSSPSLAFQVHQILGSTLEEVDEEIDKDWETSRNVLRQSLVRNGSQWL